MLRHHTLLLVVTCLATTGCITGFRHPLGPVGDGYIDDRLLGVWTCVSTTDASPGEITFLKFDSRQYYVRMTDGQSEAQDLRAVSTRLEQSSFLSLRMIGPKPEEEWTVLQYTIPDGAHLTLKYVNPDRFEDVIDDWQAVRDLLASSLEDSEVVSELLQCARHEAAHVAGS